MLTKGALRAIWLTDSLVLLKIQVDWLYFRPQQFHSGQDAYAPMVTDTLHELSRGPQNSPVTLGSSASSGVPCSQHCCGSRVSRELCSPRSRPCSFPLTQPSTFSKTRSRAALPLPHILPLVPSLRLWEISKLQQLKVQCLFLFLQLTSFLQPSFQCSPCPWAGISSFQVQRGVLENDPGTIKGD